MTMLDNFYEENYQKIVQYYKEQGQLMGFETEEELNEYVSETIGFTYVGTIHELSELEKDFYVMFEEGDMVIAETFSGRQYS